MLPAAQPYSIEGSQAWLHEKEENESHIASAASNLDLSAPWKAAAEQQDQQQMTFICNSSGPSKTTEIAPQRTSERGPLIITVGESKAKSVLHNPPLIEKKETVQISVVC